MYCERTEVSSKSYDISLKYSWKLIYILDGSSTDTALITPCRCKGTLQLVHRNCLERWVRTADTKSCEVKISPKPISDPNQFLTRILAVSS